MTSTASKCFSIALGGILSAICVILMFCTGLIPVGAYILPAAAGIVIWIIYREINRKWALLAYAAVALLSVLLTPDIEAKLLFAAFFGYYPVVRDLLEKLKPKPIAVMARFAVFNVPVIAVYAFLLNILGMAELMSDFAGLGEFAVLTFWLLGNFTFLCYDIYLGQMSFIYDRFLRKKVKRIFK